MMEPSAYAQSFGMNATTEAKKAKFERQSGKAVSASMRGYNPAASFPKSIKQFDGQLTQTYSAHHT
jgi:hypothetical protein